MFLGSIIVVPYVPARSLRSAEQNLLVVKRYNLERYGRRSFSVAGPSLWNALPSAIRNYVSTCFQIQSQNSPFSRGVCHSVVAVL